jgi:Fic family protein
MIIDYNNKIIEYSKYRVTDYPVKHRDKVPFNPCFRLNKKYRQVINQIRKDENILSEMILSDTDYRNLVVSTYSDKVHWSVKIDGNDMPIQELNRLSMLFSCGVSEDESKVEEKREIFNHMYSYFIKNEFSLPWTPSLIKMLHEMLFDNVGQVKDPKGFRTEESSFINKDGFEYFIACPPKKIEEELDGLLNWLKYSPFDELITSIIFFHEFESIHPFRSGNGRTGRTLFQMLLQELGLKNSKLCTVEKELLKDPGTYYSLLIYTDATLDYCPLIMYISEALLRSYEETIIAFSEKDLRGKMDSNMISIVKKAKTIDEFSVTEATQWLSDLSEQSVRNKLNELVDMRVLEKRGMTRSQRFRFKDPFRDLKTGLKWGSVDH